MPRHLAAPWDPRDPWRLRADRNMGRNEEDKMKRTIWMKRAVVCLISGLILAAAAGKRSAEKLQVSPTSPVLEVQRCAYSKDGRLIEYMEMFYEPHHYTFEVELYLSAE